MKSSIKFTDNKVFVGALFLLIVLNVIGTISEDPLFLQSSKPLFIPVFLICFFIKNKLTVVPFSLFLMYSFLGDMASIFFSNETFLKESSVLYLLSYSCLVSFIISKFKLVQFNKVIALYLVTVVLINVYFLYAIYSVLQTIVPDTLEVFLFAMKSISLVVLAIIAFGVYLNSETKLSILFLIMALSFVCSDVLNYVSQYYVYHWSFLMLDRMLHVIGLFFLFNYIIEYHKVPKTELGNKENIVSKNILV